MSLPVTITQRALSTAEIVGEILSWINVPNIVVPHPDDSTTQEILKPGRLRALFRCALVNRLWFNESVRFLWRDLRFVRRLDHRPFLLICMEHCDLSRRQFYANFVQRASLTLVKGPEADLEIDHVVFPRLEWLFLDSSQRTGIFFSRIRCPNLKVLEIEPDYDEDSVGSIYNFDQTEWDELLDQIATLIPSLETIKITDYTIVWPGALARFEERMPRLKTLETSMVIETNHDYYMGPPM